MLNVDTITNSRVKKKHAYYKELKKKKYPITIH